MVVNLECITIDVFESCSLKLLRLYWVNFMFVGW